MKKVFNRTVNVSGAGTHEVLRIPKGLPGTYLIEVYPGSWDTLVVDSYTYPDAFAAFIDADTGGVHICAAADRVMLFGECGGLVDFVIDAVTTGTGDRGIVVEVYKL
jgi:hypothetical protein